MTSENPITELLAAPMGPGWTIEGFAEQLLHRIASQSQEDAAELSLDAAATTDRQSQRVLRPLLACLATKSAAEAGISPNLYGGQLSFKRIGPEGPVWIRGEFENKPGNVRAKFQRTSAAQETCEQGVSDQSAVPSAGTITLSPSDAERPEKSRKRRKPRNSKREVKPRKVVTQVVITIDEDLSGLDVNDIDKFLDSLKEAIRHSGEVEVTRKTSG